MNEDRMRRRRRGNVIPERNVVGVTGIWGVLGRFASNERSGEDVDEVSVSSLVVVGGGALQC